MGMTFATVPGARSVHPVRLVVRMPGFRALDGLGIRPRPPKTSSTT